MGAPSGGVATATWLRAHTVELLTPPRSTLRDTASGCNPEYPDSSLKWKLYRYQAYVVNFMIILIGGLFNYLQYLMLATC